LLGCWQALVPSDKLKVSVQTSEKPNIVVVLTDNDTQAYENVMHCRGAECSR
jgi:hypothetical protein